MFLQTAFILFFTLQIIILQTVLILYTMLLQIVFILYTIFLQTVLTLYTMFFTNYIHASLFLLNARPFDMVLWFKGWT